MKNGQRRKEFRSAPQLVRPVRSDFEKVSLGGGAGVEEDHRLSSMMILETGFPFTRTGLNGLKGPGLAAGRSFPSATKAAMSSSSVRAEFRSGFFSTATGRFRLVTRTDWPLTTNRR